VITDAYFAPESEVSNPWVQVEKKLLQDYAPSLYAKSGLDGNTQYGIALAYTFVQALQAAGKNLTRAGLLAAIAKSGNTFITPASCLCRTRAACTTASKEPRSSSSAAPHPKR
jgi:hypothetical protein